MCLVLRISPRKGYLTVLAIRFRCLIVDSTMRSVRVKPGYLFLGEMRSMDKPGTFYFWEAAELISLPQPQTKLSKQEFEKETTHNFAAFLNWKLCLLSERMKKKKDWQFE
eukprot:Pompholyxophrys_punicea_v1_NODE_311_length_2303_cov_6.795374.p2 type:complete len:110 gc:universal NODE_311_length_2303_cov_6.795374:1227-1556(+)